MEHQGTKPKNQFSCHFHNNTGSAFCFNFNFQNSKHNEDNKMKLGNKKGKKKCFLGKKDIICIYLEYLGAKTTQSVPDWKLNYHKGLGHGPE